MYKLIVAALPIAVSHDYKSRAAHLRIRAVDAEPGRVRLGIDLILGRGEAIRVALKAVMPAQRASRTDESSGLPPSRE
ncbi:hypothetical protein DP092_02095 [Pseudomonas sp. MDMC224]|nr:hypothetical protein DP092_02095 [Pseudomonas sp. MDMC224]